MLKRTVFLAAALGIVAPTLASAADFSGPRVVKGDFGKAIRYTLLCLPTVQNKQISGECYSVNGRILPTTGRFDGGHMRFKHQTEYNGSGLELNYSGATEADGRVRGMISRLSDGVFAATPLLDDTIDHLTAWNLTVNFGNGIAYTVVCAFKAKGADLAGPCAVVQGYVMQMNGAVAGDRVTFGYDTKFQGRPVRVDYAGGLQANGSFKGTIKAGDAAGAFTATQP